MTSEYAREELARRRRLLFRLLAGFDFDRPDHRRELPPEPGTVLAALETADTLIFR